MGEAAVDLGGGSTRVTRVGGRVLRSRRQGSANVERLLVELERRGFAYTPRFLGVSDDGRQILRFIEGQAGGYPLPERLRSDEVLVSVAEVLREWHEATRDFAAQVIDGWMLEAVEPYEVICHGDVAPYNCVFDGSRVVGLIDLDTAHPGPRIRDVAYAVYRFAPLTAPGNEAGFGSLAEQARRARLFCDHYGEVDRARVVEVLCQRLADLVDYMRTEAARGDAAFQSHLDQGHDAVYLRDIAYLRDHASALTEVLAAPART